METLLVAKRDLVIARILDRLIDGRLSCELAARELGKSIRQIRRLRRRYEQTGVAGLRSRHFGRRAANRLDEALRARVIDTVRALYPDFGPTLANEKLRAEHDVILSTESVRQLMIEAGLWHNRKRKTYVHQPRERRPHYGELAQIDGSLHDWFEGRAPRCTLLVAIDDATSTYMHLLFVKRETTDDYFTFVSGYRRLNGKPGGFYSDKHAICRNHLRASRSLNLTTQFARAMSELNIELICANTPQAKGRVERANATLQDRLVKELRLRNISSIEAANTFLAEYRLELNRRFQKPPRLSGDGHRALAPHEDLTSILAHVEERVLSKSLTFQFGADLYRIVGERGCTPGLRVRVERTKAGIQVQYAGRKLECEFVATPKNTRVLDRAGVSERRMGGPDPKKAHKPPANHPWNMPPRSVADPDILAWETPDITALG